MAKFFALHKPMGDPKEGWDAFGKVAPKAAADMASGKTPAKCLKTWNPYAFGRSDFVFCLWEADKLEDVEAVLREYGFYSVVTADVMPVVEIDWAEMAKSA